MVKKKEPEKDGFQAPECVPVCGFCSAPWTEDMLSSFYESSGGCDTCGFGSSKSIEITCESCKRLIYKKDYY